MDTAYPYLITLSSAGAGIASLRGEKLLCMRRVSRVEIIMSTAGSGSVELVKDGRRLAIKTLAARMIAGGEVELAPGQQLDVVIAQGPAGQQITITFHFEDVREDSAP